MDLIWYIEGGKVMNNKKRFVFLMSFILVLLISCIKRSHVSTEGISGELPEMPSIIYVNENHVSRRSELIELIRKVPYPDEPQQFIWEILRGTESFLELENYSEELLGYALDLFQDDALTRDEKRVVAYIMLGIDFEQYKYLLRDVAVYFVEGKIDRFLAGFLFFPGHTGYGASINNFGDPVLREALETYIKSDEIRAETRESIINDLKLYSNKR